ncbi:MAG: AI-2E family transporter [Gammaproteobacteria bacterium]|jgi:predicted PurR-regulated permease PerM|nr:AI-2E family transporter [Gammaproteobacteria bacterium]
MDRKLMLTLTAFAALAGALYLLFRVLEPFLPAIGWASVLAIVTYPLYLRLRRTLHGRDGLASALMTLAVFAVIVVPVIAIVALLLRELVEAEQWLRSAAAEGKIPRIDAVLAHPTVKGWVDRLSELAMTAGIDLRERALAAAQGVIRLLLGGVTSTAANVFGFLFQLFLVLVVLFFVYRDGPAAERVFWSGVRIDEATRATLRDTVAGMVSAVAVGVVVTAAVQGVLGGIGFWFTGLPSPVLFGALTTISAFIPVIGTALVWIPAVAYLLLSGATTDGVILAVWSVLVVGSVDNILRPILMSGRTGLPLPLMMMGALGGLLAFGLFGLVMGPLLIALLLVLLDRYRASLGGAGPRAS